MEDTVELGQFIGLCQESGEVSLRILQTFSYRQQMVRGGIGTLSLKRSAIAGRFRYARGRGGSGGAGMFGCRFAGRIRRNRRSLAAQDCQQVGRVLPGGLARIGFFGCIGHQYTRLGFYRGVFLMLQSIRMPAPEMCQTL